MSSLYSHRVGVHFVKLPKFFYMISCWCFVDLWGFTIVSTFLNLAMVNYPLVLFLQK